MWWCSCLEPWSLLSVEEHKNPTFVDTYSNSQTHTTRTCDAHSHPHKIVPSKQCSLFLCSLSVVMWHVKYTTTSTPYDFYSLVVIHQMNNEQYPCSLYGLGSKWRDIDPHDRSSYTICLIVHRIVWEENKQTRHPHIILKCHVLYKWDPFLVTYVHSQSPYGDKWHPLPLY